MKASGNTRITIVDCGSRKVADIVRILEELGVVATVITPSQLATLNADLPAAIIISGNPALIRDTGVEFLKHFESLSAYTIPVLGICFGHQVIGLLYGAEVTMGKEDRDLREMEILQIDPLFTGLLTENMFKEDHTEVVSLPDDFILLARSSCCSNEAMMHRTLPLYGVQFHPESSGSAGRQLIENFLTLVENHTS
jgi:GMP synthase (glutamine-hydrolysing)